MREGSPTPTAVDDELHAIDVDFDWGYGDNRHKIGKIKLPWTPEQWIRTIDKDGDVLGQCCSAISEARDILIESLREGGWLTPDELKQALDFIAECRGDCGDREEDESDPLSVLSRIWNVLDGRCVRHAPEPGPDTRDTGDSNLMRLAQACERLAFDNMFAREETPEGQHRQRVSRAVCLSTFLPALHAVVRDLDTFLLGTAEGYAAYLPDGKIVRTVGGLAIYQTEGEMRGVLADWRKHGEDGDAFADVITVKRVRVSAEKGVEVIE